MEIEEHEAIRRVLAGDPDAYRTLLERHLPSVLRMTLRVTGNSEDAEEAAHEGFARAYRKLPSFQKNATFGTWVYRIAMNCALDILKRRQRDLTWQAASLDDDPVAAHSAVAAGPTPEAALLEIEATRRREVAMQCLTPMERTAFVLRHQEEQRIEAVAAALGVNSNSARQTVYRAVAKLRKALAPGAAASPHSQPSSEPMPAHPRAPMAPLRSSARSAAGATARKEPL